MSEAITFTAPGIPQPQGSARAYTYQRSKQKGGGIGARVTSDNPQLDAWRLNVALAARLAYRRPQPLAGPIFLRASFILSRPKRLRKALTPQHIVKPDLDKLVRAIGDALIGVLVVDDAQIIRVDAHKRYAGPSEEPGAVVTVSPALSFGGEQA